MPWLCDVWNLCGEFNCLFHFVNSTLVPGGHGLWEVRAWVAAND